MAANSYAALPLAGLIKRYTPSFCLSVCSSVPCGSIYIKTRSNTIHNRRVRRVAKGYIGDRLFCGRCPLLSPHERL